MSRKVFPEPDIVGFHLHREKYLQFSHRISYNYVVMCSESYGTHPAPHVDLFTIIQNIHITICHFAGNEK